MHCFALFITNITASFLKTSHDLYSSDNKVLIHRIRHVLRLKPDDTCIFFDVDGQSAQKWLLALEGDSLVACAGPEGDLTTDEKLFLKERGFLFCALTPTVLRAVHTKRLL